MGKEKITIKEIAKQAGVSIATVSHVINRTRYVSPELEEKVKNIVAETGYSENRKSFGYCGGISESDQHGILQYDTGAEKTGQSTGISVYGGCHRR